MKSFISASTISWFYFIENMTTVLLSDTPWCFSPTMIIRYPCSIYCCNQYFKLKKRLNHIYIISCVLCHFPGLIKYQIYHRMKRMCLTIYLLISIILTLLYCPSCFVSNSKTIRVWSIAILLYFFATFWLNKNPHANTC